MFCAYMGGPAHGHPGVKWLLEVLPPVNLFCCTYSSNNSFLFICLRLIKQMNVNGIEEEEKYLFC